jgi:hypothetical protein
MFRRTDYSAMVALFFFGVAVGAAAASASCSSGDESRPGVQSTGAGDASDAGGVLGGRFEPAGAGGFRDFPAASVADGAPDGAPGLFAGAPEGGPGGPSLAEPPMGAMMPKN